MAFQHQGRPLLLEQKDPFTRHRLRSNRPWFRRALLGHFHRPRAALMTWTATCQVTQKCSKGSGQHLVEIFASASHPELYSVWNAITVVAPFASGESQEEQRWTSSCRRTRSWPWDRSKQFQWLPMKMVCAKGAPQEPVEEEERPITSQCKKLLARCNLLQWRQRQKLEKNILFEAISSKHTASDGRKT